MIPFFSELELELYLLRKEPELELAELDQLLELAPPLESVPLLELAPGIQCLGQSNRTICSPLSQFVLKIFKFFHFHTVEPISISTNGICSSTGIGSKFESVQDKIDLELELEPHNLKKVPKSESGAGSTSELQQR